MPLCTYVWGHLNLAVSIYLDSMFSLTTVHFRRVTFTQLDPYRRLLTHSIYIINKYINNICLSKKYLNHFDPFIVNPEKNYFIKFIIQEM